MTKFQYKGVSQTGAEVKGVVAAYDRYDAISKARQTCPVVTEVQELSSKDVGDIFGSQKVSLKALSLMPSRMPQPAFQYPRD